MTSACVARLQGRFLLCTLLLCTAACATDKPTPGLTQPAASDAPSRPGQADYDRACDEFDRAIAALEAGDSSGCKRLVKQAMLTLQQSGLDRHVRTDSLGVLEKLPYFAQNRAYAFKEARDFWIDVVLARHSAGMVEGDGSSVALPAVSVREFAEFTVSLRERDAAAGSPKSDEAMPTTQANVDLDLDRSSNGSGDAIVAGAIASKGDSESERSKHSAPTLEVTETTSIATGAGEASDPRLLAAQLDLAKVQIAQGKLDEARRILEDVLAEIELRGMKGGRDELLALALFSASYKVEGDFERARIFDQRRAQLASEALPEGDPERELAHKDLAAMDLATNSSGSASSGEPDAPRGGSASSQRNHPASRKDRWNVETWDGGNLPSILDGVQLTRSDSSTPQSDRDSPEVLESQGGFDDAIVGYRDRLAGVPLRTPSDVHSRNEAREGEARCHEAQGRIAAAAGLRERNLEEAQEHLDDSDPLVQRARRALARSRRAQGDLTAARSLQDAACATLAATLPPDHADLMAARLWLGELLHELGETEAALLVLEQALSAEVGSAVDRARMAALVREALDLQAACSYDEAIALRREIVEIGRRVLPSGSPVHAESVRELAALLRVAGEREEARSLERQVGHESDLQDWPGLLRARAAEASNRGDDAQRHPPTVDLTLTASDPRGRLEVVAVVRDATGVASLSLGIDGVLYELALRPPQWTPDADGMGGRLELSLPDPGGIVAVVTLVAENEAAGRETQSRALVSDG